MRLKYSRVEVKSEDKKGKGRKRRERDNNEKGKKIDKRAEN